MNSCESRISLTPDPTTTPLSHFVMEAERQYLEACLAATGNNKTKAAAMAGISRSTLKEKLSRYNVTVSVSLG